MYISHMTLSTTGARAAFSEILNRAAFGKERLVLTRRGRRVAAVVPVEDLELLEALEDRLDLDEARQALDDARRRRERPRSWEKVKARLGL
jgi:prevent-host-death family protein